MNRAVLIVTILLLSLTLQVAAQSSDSTTQSETAGKATAASQIVDQKPYDQSDELPLLLAAESGSGFAPGASQPSAYAGVRLGIENITLDLGYDRVHGQSGFATQFSGMIPVFRLPGPQKDERKNYLRVYLEPGIGHHAGAGGFGGYLSGGIMVALLSDQRLDLKALSPFIEYQRRVPFSAPGHGDNRFTFGVLMALCAHCGLD